MPRRRLQELALEIPERRLEIDVIIELLRRVDAIRKANPRDYSKDIYLAKKGLDLIWEELEEQVRRNGVNN